MKGLLLLPILLLAPLSLTAEEITYQDPALVQEENPEKYMWSPSINELLHRIKNHKTLENATPPVDAINNALADLEWNYGSDDPAIEKVLLQFPSSLD